MKAHCAARAISDCPHYFTLRYQDGGSRARLIRFACSHGAPTEGMHRTRPYLGAPTEGMHPCIATLISGRWLSSRNVSGAPTEGMRRSFSVTVRPGATRANHCRPARATALQVNAVRCMPLGQVAMAIAILTSRGARPRHTYSQAQLRTPGSRPIVNRSSGHSAHTGMRKSPGRRVFVCVERLAVTGTRSVARYGFVSSLRPSLSEPTGKCSCSSHFQALGLH